jgi:hypothetical protein
MNNFVEQKRVLIVFYSFSSQTRNLLNGLARGLEEGGVAVQWEQLKPLTPPPFPVGSYWGAFKMMLSAFCKRRIAIEPPDRSRYVAWDLVICAGPTWSYHPSGPMLSFLDNYAREMFKGLDVLPLISCRRYWRLHHWEMKRALRGEGVRFLKPHVFSHPSPGIWCALGLFLKLAGKIPGIWRPVVQRYCPRYGHSPRQIEQAKSFGRSLANRLQEGRLKYQ